MGITGSIGAAELGGRTNHWAFRPPVSPRVPESVVGWGVDGESASRNPVDRFIQERLRKEGLRPSAVASRFDRLRRVTYDLTGLPPSQSEVEGYLRDEAPGAWERVVDRLLASPRYGERWGRYWLDVARYADTKGYVFYYEESQFVQPHRYRDWVVEMMNRDLPYGDFLRWQIAGDQIWDRMRAGRSGVRAGGVSTAQARMDEGHPWLAAMGFLTLGRRFLGNPHDIIDDQLDVMMRGLQGVTIGCARCHDHKYDPISLADYYGLHSVFLKSRESVVPLEAAPGPETLMTYREAKARVEFEQELERRVAKFDAAFRKASDEVADRLRGRVVDYWVAATEREKLPTLSANVRPAPGDVNPFNVRQWAVYLDTVARGKTNIFGPWFYWMARLRGGGQGGGERNDGLGNALVLESLKTPPTDVRDLAERYGKLLVGAHEAWKAALAAAKTNGGPAPKALPDRAQEELRQILYGPDSPVWVPAGQMTELNVHLYFDDPNRVALAKMQMEVEQWLDRGPGRPAYGVILEDRVEPVVGRVFKRGDPDKPGESVSARYPAGLLGGAARELTRGSGRLEFAEALLDPANPLTARVWVNRVWAQMFGVGLVRTPSDFGVRGEAPSHPELLDWLACRFVAEGGSLKALHRLLVTSATYQQSAISRETTSEKVDPENRLLWRMNRRRLDYEAMRDSYLAVTGELDLKMGGPGEGMDGAGATVRRTVYGKVDRKFVPAVMKTFDVANPDLHSPQRFCTVIPQQALFLLNHEFVQQRAEALATRLAEAEGAGDFGRDLDRTYGWLFQRTPRDRERELAREYLGGRGVRDARAAWVNFAQVLFLSSEFVFLE